MGRKTSFPVGTNMVRGIRVNNETMLEADAPITFTLVKSEQNNCLIDLAYTRIYLIIHWTSEA